MKNTGRSMLPQHPATITPPQSAQYAGLFVADPHTNHNNRPVPAQPAGAAAPAQLGRRADQRCDPVDCGLETCADRPLLHALAYATASVVSALAETPPIPQAPLWFPSHRRHLRQHRHRQIRRLPSPRQQHRQDQQRQLNRRPQQPHRQPILLPQYRPDPAGLPPLRDRDPHIAVPPLSPGFSPTSASRRPFPRRSDTDPRDVSPWRLTPPHQRLMRRWEKDLE